MNLEYASPTTGSPLGCVTAAATICPRSGEGRSGTAPSAAPSTPAATASTAASAIDHQATALKVHKLRLFPETAHAIGVHTHEQGRALFSGAGLVGCQHSATDHQGIITLFFNSRENFRTAVQWVKDCKADGGGGGGGAGGRAGGVDGEDGMYGGEGPAVQYYRVGQQIEARYEGGPEFYPGSIVFANADGTVNVQYADGNQEMDVDGERVRPLPLDCIYYVGQVRAAKGEYSVTVHSILRPSTFSISLCTQNHVPNSTISYGGLCGFY